MRIDRHACLVLTLMTGAMACPATGLAQAPLPVSLVPHQTPDAPSGAGQSPVLLRADAAAACGGQGLARLDGQDFPPGLYGQTFGLQAGQRIARVALDFTIDAQGRTRDIRPVPGNADADGPLSVFNGPAGEIVQATLAGWRFAPSARTDCRLTIRYTPVPIDRADTDLLLAYYGVTRTSGTARTAIRARLGGPGTDCVGTGPLRRAAYPDFRVGPRRPGVQDWTVVRWNVDAEGRVTDAETLGSSDDATFDTEARATIARSEAFPGQAHTGCTYNWFRRGGVLAAPPMPDAPPDPASACPAGVLSSFRPRASALMPEAFSARGVEGWALVRFDIAPWGEVGAVSVIEAQPAAAFADAARAIVAGGRAEPGPGAVRCIQPVVFRLPPEP